MKEIPKRIRPLRHARCPIPLPQAAVGGVLYQQRGEVFAHDADSAKESVEERIKNRGHLRESRED